MGSLRVRRRQKNALGLRAVTRWFALLTPHASRRRTAWLRQRPLRHQALAVRRLLVQWSTERAAPARHCGKMLWLANKHNAELCKVLCTTPCLPVRIISRYV